jgi:hypothetical protein
LPRLRLWIALVLVITLAPGLFLFNSCSKTNQIIELKAVIVDPLYLQEPDQKHINDVQKLLVESGFKVDIAQGEQITVDFFRHLAEPGYQVIIVRAHSGLLGAGGKAIPKTCIFTNEPYSETQHISEQLSDKLAKARINPNSPWVFAVGADFIRQSLKGNFNHSLVIMMGCSTLYMNDAAKACVDKGATAYIGWDLSVGVHYVDDATLTLMNKLCHGKLNIDKAVAATMDEKGRDPDFGATLKFYPQTSGKLTLKEIAGR